MDQSLLTEAHLRALVPEKIFQRGDAYCRRGAVVEIARRGDVLHASVEGSDELPYLVQVTTRGDRILAKCDCPYAGEWGEWCKHIAATILVVARRHVEITVQPTVQELLQPLDRESMARLFELLVELEPQLYAVIRTAIGTSMPEDEKRARAYSSRRGADSASRDTESRA